MRTVNKQGMWKEFFPDGKVKTETRFINNEVNGYKKEYDINGNIITFLNIDNFILFTIYVGIILVKYFINKLFLFVDKNKYVKYR